MLLYLDKLTHFPNVKAHAVICFISLPEEHYKWPSIAASEVLHVPYNYMLLKIS